MKRRDILKGLGLARRAVITRERDDRWRGRRAVRRDSHVDFKPAANGLGVKYLAGAPEELDLPFDRPRPEESADTGRKASVGG